MREEITAIRWLVLGSLAASLPMCNNLILDADFEDADGEREVLRTIFLGSFMAAACSLPLNLSDEERSFIIEGVEEDAKFDVNWKMSATWFVLIGLESPPVLTHETRTDVFNIHASLLAKSGDPLRSINLAAINMSLDIALRIFSSFLIDFECPEEW